MEWGELLNWILGILTLIASGGWFVNWRAHKRQEDAKAIQSEQDIYQEMLTDLETHNERLRKFNAEISDECEQLRKRVAENENKLLKQDDKLREQEKKLATQENKIESLEHRLELVTEMMCGKSNCQQRTRVFLTPVDDDSFMTRKNQERT